MTFSQSTFIAPSGQFVSTAHYCTGDSIAETESFSPIYNPSVLDRYAQDTATDTRLSEWLEDVRAPSYRVAQNEFEAYGERLIELTHHVQGTRPHCSLGPLRGAAKPCVMVEVMSRGTCEYEYFNFQRGSDPKTHPRIISDLTEILHRHDPAEEVYRINITDTAIGGQGINSLVDLLGEIKDSKAEFKHQQWAVDINLLHDPSANIGNIKRVLSRREGFQIQLTRYVVSSLIVEDYDPALAFELEWDGDRHIFKPGAKAGRFLYSVGNEVYVVESDNCYLTFEQLYSRAITESLLTSPQYEQIGVVWHEYQEKG